MYYLIKIIKAVFVCYFLIPASVPLGGFSNGYSLGLSGPPKDPTWTFKDTLIYNGQHQQVF